RVRRLGRLQGVPRDGHRVRHRPARRDPRRCGMRPTPCAYCDTYGPFVRDEQYVRDLHRLTHEVSRTYQRMFAPPIDAMHTIGKAAQDTTATMLDLPHEDPVNALIIQPGDDITLTNALGTADCRVTRID